MPSTAQFDEGEKDADAAKARKYQVSDQRHEVDPIIGDAVGSQLKSLFTEFANEAVPDRFAKLIAQLEQVEAAEAAEQNDQAEGGK